MPLRADSHPGAAVPAGLRDLLLARIQGELSLPMLPDNAARILAACQDERSDMSALAQLMEHDPSLAAHILRIANSAGYAPMIPILSLQQAIGRVGLAAVADVAIALVLAQRVFSAPGYEARIRTLWLHSALTAYYAKEIAQLMRRDFDSAFLCGLLHDVGMPITLQVVCDLEREGTVPPVTPEVMEALMAEFHAELGARVAKAWKLGPWVGLVILHHHDPAGAKYHPLEIPVVALADRLAYWAVDPRADEQDFQVDPELPAALNLHEGALLSLLRRRARVLEAAEALV